MLKTLITQDPPKAFAVIERCFDKIIKGRHDGADAFLQIVHSLSNTFNGKYRAKIVSGVNQCAAVLKECPLLTAQRMVYSNEIQRAATGLREMILMLEGMGYITSSDHPNHPKYLKKMSPHVEVGLFEIPGRNERQECVVLVRGFDHAYAVLGYLELRRKDVYQPCRLHKRDSHETMHPLVPYDGIFASSRNYCRYEHAVVIPLSILTQKGLVEKLRVPANLINDRAKLAKEGYELVYQIAKKIISDGLKIDGPNGSRGTDAGVQETWVGIVGDSIARCKFQKFTAILKQYMGDSFNICEWYPWGCEDSSDGFSMDYTSFDTTSVANLKAYVQDPKAQLVGNSGETLTQELIG